MSQSNTPSPDPQSAHDFFPSFIWAARHRWQWWVIPAASCFVLAVGYALFSPKTWQATQSLVVRDEWVGQATRPGRFESLDSMKTAQETIQEVARNPAVLGRTLERVGPARGKPHGDWPGERDVEDIRDAISFHAPNGAEFGKTEILRMAVKASSRERALKVAEALFFEMESELRTVRGQRAASMQTELEQRVVVAGDSLSQAAEKLAALETQVGPDLGELRMLADQVANEGPLQRALPTLESDLREAGVSLDQHKQQREELRSVAVDPDQLLATPNELLEAQPALKRLKDGLVDAQLTLSTLSGRFTGEHPSVQAAKLVVEDVKQQIHREIPTALAGVETQLAIAQQRFDALQAQAAEYRERLDRLAAMRVDYLQLSEQVRLRTEALNEAQTELAQARAMGLAADQSNLITRIDRPQVGTRPLGLSKRATVLVGTLGGLAIGLGFLVWVTPQQIPPHRYGATGRRPTTPISEAHDWLAASSGLSNQLVGDPFQSLGPFVDATEYETEESLLRGVVEDESSLNDSVDWGEADRAIHESEFHESKFHDPISNAPAPPRTLLTTAAALSRAAGEPTRETIGRGSSAAADHDSHEWPVSSEPPMESDFEQTSHAEPLPPQAVGWPAASSFPGIPWDPYAAATSEPDAAAPRSIENLSEEELWLETLLADVRQATDATEPVAHDTSAESWQPPPSGPPIVLVPRGHSPHSQPELPAADTHGQSRVADETSAQHAAPSPGSPASNLPRPRYVPSAGWSVASASADDSLGSALLPDLSGGPGQPASGNTDPMNPHAGGEAPVEDIAQNSRGARPIKPAYIVPTSSMVVLPSWPPYPQPPQSATD
jgi:uncharacterized protein involved in exopolysaccharide biosynthesis